MAIRSCATLLLGAAAVCSFALAGCRQTCHRCHASPSCDCCTGANQPATPHQPQPASAGPEYRPGPEGRAPLPPGGQPARVRLPQSGEVVYREATLMERVKFRLQRWNPLSGSAADDGGRATQQSGPDLRPVPEPALPYAPAPSAEVRPRQGDEPVSTLRGFEPARIDLREVTPATGRDRIAGLEPWPDSPQETHTTIAQPVGNSQPLHGPAIRRVRNFD